MKPVHKAIPLLLLIFSGSSYQKALSLYIYFPWFRLPLHRRGFACDPFAAAFGILRRLKNGQTLLSPSRLDPTFSVAPESTPTWCR